MKLLNQETLSLYINILDLKRTPVKSFWNTDRELFCLKGAFQKFKKTKEGVISSVAFLEEINIITWLYHLLRK